MPTNNKPAYPSLLKHLFLLKMRAIRTFAAVPAWVVNLPLYFKVSVINGWLGVVLWSQLNPGPCGEHSLFLMCVWVPSKPSLGICDTEIYSPQIGNKQSYGYYPVQLGDAMTFIGDIYRNKGWSVTHRNKWLRQKHHQSPSQYGWQAHYSLQPRTHCTAWHQLSRWKCVCFKS